MRRSFVFLVHLALALTPVATAGCASIFHLDEYSTEDAPPAAPLVADPGGGTPSSVEQTEGAPAANCRTNAACGASGSVCVRATGRCEQLVTAECPHVYGDTSMDDAVLVGTLLDEALERAAVLAAEEISLAQERPIVVVACNTSDAIAAAHHLVDVVHVPAIIGPMDGEDVVEITQQISAKGSTLVMTPTSLTSAISNLADDDLTWRAAPSDAQRANLVIGQMSALEDVLRSTRGLATVKLGIVHRTDALGLSARDAISGKLIINNRFINDAANATNVSIDGYGGPADAPAEAAIVTRYATSFKPDLVFVTAPEQVSDVIVPLEKALTAARAVNRPYYVCTEAAKTQALLDAVTEPGMPADLRRRIRGIGATSDLASAQVFAGFGSRFSARFGASPGTFATAATYDATYAIAFAAVAAPPAKLSGASVAQGLRALGLGDALAVGPGEAANAIARVSSGKSVSLRGANTLMQWDGKGDLAAGTVEVWCIGTATGTPTFGSSGLLMDVATQVVGGAFVQCQ